MTIVIVTVVVITIVTIIIKDNTGKHHKGHMLPIDNSTNQSARVSCCMLTTAAGKHYKGYLLPVDHSPGQAKQKTFDTWGKKDMWH